MLSSLALTFLSKETSEEENWNLYYRDAFFLANNDQTGKDFRVMEMMEAFKLMDTIKTTMFQVVYGLNACWIF